MKKNLSTILGITVGVLISLYGLVNAAPVSTILRNIMPENTLTYDIGSTTPNNLRFFHFFGHLASSSSESFVGNIYIGGTASTTGTATTTIVGANATSTFSGGIRLAQGCFEMANGTCAGTGGGGGTPGGSDTQVQFNDAGSFQGDSAFTWLQTPNILTISGGLVSTLSTSTSATTSDLWASGITRLASSTIGGQLTIGELNATTTATSTFAGGISTNLLNVTSGTASSTFSGGIVVAGGVKVSTYNCSTGYGNGGKLTTDGNGYLTCASDVGGGGSVTVNTGAANNLAYYSASDTIDDATFLNIDTTNGRLGIGTSSPIAQFSIDTDTNPYAIWVGDKGGANASTTPFFAITGSGQILIGTTTGTSTPQPNWTVQIASTSPFLTLSDTNAIKDQKHWTLSSNSGNFYLATASDAYATATIPAFTIATSGSTTIASILNVGGSGTSTITGAIRVASSTATSTFVGNIATNLLNVTSSSASSTFAGGIVLADGRGIKLGAPTNCNGDFVLETDADGDVTCGADGGGAGSPGGSDEQIQYNNASSFGGASNLFYDDDVTPGRVGIGTTTPWRDLTVVGDFLVSGKSTTTYATSTSYTATSTTGSFFAGGTGAVTTPSFSWNGDPDTGIYSGGANNLAITTGGVSRWNIDATDIIFSVPQRGPSGSASTPTYTFSADTSAGIYYKSAVIVGIGINSTPVLEVTNSSPDYVLFGDSDSVVTGSPIIRSSVTGTALAPVYSFANDADNGMFTDTTNTLQFSSGGVERLRLSSSGFIGIATTSPATTTSIHGNLLVSNMISTALLTATGTVTFKGLAAGAAGDNDVCLNSTTGRLTDAGATACVVSSLRYKENFEPIANAIPTIMQLNPFRFNYKPELDGSIIKGRKHFGLGAEEVEKVIPDIIRYENDGVTPRTLEYSEIIPFLIRGIQEQQKQIESLENRIKELEK